MPPIHIVSSMNIRIVVLLAPVAGFPIFNDLVIFHMTNRTIPVDKKGTRPDIEGKE